MNRATEQYFEELATRMQNLDQGAFEEFSVYFAPRFRSLFIRSGLFQTQAEDLAINCASDIALKVEKYRSQPGGSFKAWTFKLARNMLVDWWHSQPDDLSLQEELLQALQEPGPNVSNHSVITAVRESVAELSQADQVILQLRDLGPVHSYQEIGKMLSIRSNTARVRHHRALERLQMKLEKDSRIQKHLSRRVAPEKPSEAMEQ